MNSNLCPVCGPVEGDLSSRYCVTHLKDLLARCVGTSASDDRVMQSDPMEWLEAALGRKAA